MHDVGAVIELDQHRRAHHVDGLVDRRSHLIHTRRQRTAERESIHAHERRRAIGNQRVLGAGLCRQVVVDHLPHDQSQLGFGDRHAGRVRCARIGAEEDVDAGRCRHDFRRRDRAHRLRLALKAERTRYRHEVGNGQRYRSRKLHHVRTVFELDADRRPEHIDGFVNRLAHPVHSRGQRSGQRQPVDANERRRAIRDEGVLRSRLLGKRGVVDYLQDQPQIRARDRDPRRLRSARVRAQERTDVRRGGDNLRRRLRANR